MVKRIRNSSNVRLTDFLKWNSHAHDMIHGEMTLFQPSKHYLLKEFGTAQAYRVGQRWFCVILPAGAVARSRNIGQTFLVNSVVNNTLGYLFTTLNSQTQLLWRHFFTEILTLQAGFFYLEAGFYTNKKSNPVRTCQKLTIQAGWPYIRGPYKWAALYYLDTLSRPSPRQQSCVRFYPLK